MKIATSQEYEAVMAQIADMWGTDLDSEQEHELDALVDDAVTYEEEHFPIPDTRKNTMKPTSFEIKLTEAEEGGYTAECTTLEGCISQGETIDEVCANIADAIELCLDEPYTAEEIAELEQRAEDCRTGKVRAIPAEEIMAEYVFGAARPNLFERMVAKDMENPEFRTVRERTRTQLGIMRSVLDLVEIDREEDGRWIAEIDAIGGCLTYGATEHEARNRCGVLALKTLADMLENNEIGE